jgi:segregation and condensation protein B
MTDELLPTDDPVAAFKRAIEAVVLVAHDPVPPELLAQLLEQPVASVDRWCEELGEEYAEQQRGFQFVRVAGGFRYQTDPDQTPYVERFVLHDQKARLSRHWRSSPTSSRSRALRWRRSAGSTPTA